MSGFNSNSRKKLPKYLRKDEVEEILGKAQNKNTEHYLILLTMWRAGLRVSEVVKLTPEDIDFESNRIEVRGGKGDKDRVVPLHKELKSALKTYVDIKNLKDDELLFNYSTRWIQKIVEKYTDKPWVSPHTFRHSFAVHVINSGLDSRKLQMMLGHSSLATTEVYLDLTAKNVIDDFLKKVE